MSSPLITDTQIENDNRELIALESLDNLKDYLNEKGCFTKWDLHEEIKPSIAVRALMNPQLLTDVDCPRIYVDHTAINAAQNDFIIIDLTDSVIESVSAVDVLPFITDFRDNFLTDVLQDQFGDDVEKPTLDIVVQNAILSALSAMIIDRSQFAMVVFIRLLMSWYPNAKDLAVVVQEVETSETSENTTVLRLIGIGSLKNKEPVSLN